MKKRTGKREKNGQENPGTGSRVARGAEEQKITAVPLSGTAERYSKERACRFICTPFPVIFYLEVYPGRNSIPADQHPQPLFSESTTAAEEKDDPQAAVIAAIRFRQNPFPHPPQQQRRRMIHRQEDMPFPFSHPHPQFVAVKSLMLNPPNRFIYSSILCRSRKSVTQSTGDNPLRERISLLKKDFSMKWVKQTVGYWCDDTKTGKCTGSGICAAVLDTGISVHPDLQGRIVGFRIL